MFDLIKIDHVFEAEKKQWFKVQLQLSDKPEIWEVSHPKGLDDLMLEEIFKIIPVIFRLDSTAVFQNLYGQIDMNQWHKDHSQLNHFVSKHLFRDVHIESFLANHVVQENKNKLNLNLPE